MLPTPEAAQQLAGERIQKRLDELDEYQCQIDLIQMDKQKLIDEVLTPWIKEQLEAIDLEFADKSESAQNNINQLRDEIKQATLVYGETVKSSKFQAVYMKGREKWDTQQLKGYSKAHPEILMFYKRGNPSISIRGVK